MVKNDVESLLCFVGDDKGRGGFSFANGSLGERRRALECCVERVRGAAFGCAVASWWLARKSWVGCSQVLMQSSAGPAASYRLRGVLLWTSFPAGVSR